MPLSSNPEIGDRVWARNLHAPIGFQEFMGIVTDIVGDFYILEYANSSFRYPIAVRIKDILSRVESA